jgi:hypothetical protein
MDIYAVPGVFIGLLGRAGGLLLLVRYAFAPGLLFAEGRETTAFPHLFDRLGGQAFPGHLFTYLRQGGFQDRGLKKGSLGTLLLQEWVIRLGPALRAKVVAEKDVFRLARQEIQHFQTFRLGHVTEGVERGPPAFLAAAAVKHLDGLPVTALRRSMNQGDFLEAAGGIPLLALGDGEQFDALEQRLLVGAFHVEGLEGKPPNLTLHSVGAEMFLQATARFG